MVGLCFLNEIRPAKQFDRGAGNHFGGMCHPLVCRRRLALRDELPRMAGCSYGKGRATQLDCRDNPAHIADVCGGNERLISALERDDEVAERPTVRAPQAERGVGGSNILPRERLLKLRR